METEIATITEKQLATLEDQVRKGSAAFIAVGQALAKIREGKGYKLRGCETFEQYCEEQFGFSDRQGRRLIQSAETAAEVKKLTGYTPASESVAREFAALSGQPEKIKKVAAAIERKGYTVVTSTAETVKEAVQALAPKPKVAPAPVTGRAVVLPGNGHASPRPLPMAPAKLDAPDGVCPWCHERPDKYEQSEETWQCCNCEGSVMLAVMAWPPQEAPAHGQSGARQGAPQCPHCKKPINAGDSFCDHCGAILD